MHLLRSFCCSTLSAASTAQLHQPQPHPTTLTTTTRFFYSSLIPITVSPIPRPSTTTSWCAPTPTLLIVHGVQTRVVLPTRIPGFINLGVPTTCCPSTPTLLPFFLSTRLPRHRSSRFTPPSVIAPPHVPTHSDSSRPYALQSPPLCLTRGIVHPTFPPHPTPTTLPTLFLLAYRRPQPVHIRPNPIGIKTLPCAVPYLFPPTPASRPFPTPLSPPLRLFLINYL